MKRPGRARDIIEPLFIAVLIGTLAGFGAVFFRLLLDGTVHFFQSLGESATNVGMPWWLFALLLPTLAGLVVGPIITFVSPEIRGPGVSEVMKTLAIHGGRIRHRVTIIKTFATSTLIAAGASVGREGPIIQIGSSIGASLTTLLKLDKDKRRMAVACGAAAGIAATFQAPMAGTLFAVEVLLFEMEASFLSYLVIASVAGTLVARATRQDAAIFHIPEFTITHFGELGLYLAMGITAGFLSLALMAVVFNVPKLFKRIAVPAWLTPALGGLGIGALGLFCPEVLGIGYESIDMALHGNIAITMALILVFVKIAATGLCIGSGMSGGIFAPSLFIGAMTGTVFGFLAQLIWPESFASTSHYALIGMGAVVCGTTLAPMTAIMTIFELTYNYEVVLPLMVACIPSLLIVRLLHGYSIYESTLLQAGVNIVRGHDVNRLRDMNVSDYMIRDFEPLKTDTPLRDIRLRMAECVFPHYVVIDKNGYLAGVLTLRDLRNLFVANEDMALDTPAADLMVKDVVTVRDDQNLETAFHLFAENDFSFLPVVQKNNPARVVGYLKKSDLVAAYDQHILKEQVLAPHTWICHLPKKR